MTAVVGYTAGVYDMFHVGHLRHLRDARSRCERLVVGVLDDDAAQALSGQRPFVPYAERVAVLESVDCVDAVVDAGEPVRCDLVMHGTDRDVPGGPAAGSAAPAASAVSVVELPDGGGTASALLRTVLDRGTARRSVA